MSEEAQEKKKGGGKKLAMIVVGGLFLGGAGVAGGLYAGGMLGGEKKVSTEDPNKPVLVLAGENAETIAESKGWKKDGGSGKAAGSAAPSGPGVDLPTPSNPAAYQATYFQLVQPFTSNLADTDAFVQISIAVSTYYDYRVIAAVTQHEMPIRSQILMLLSQETSALLDTPEGKQQLQQKLVKVVNDVLKQKTGYGGVDNIYFTNFVIQ